MLSSVHTNVVQKQFDQFSKSTRSYFNQLLTYKHLIHYSIVHKQAVNTVTTSYHLSFDQSFNMVLYPDVPKWEVAMMKPEQHPTALEVIKRDNVSLRNKTVLITGGSAGIGVETVRALAYAGARVFVLARSVDKTRVILDKIAAEFPQHGGLEIIQGELDSLASVDAAANDFLKRSDQLNILINNAGIYQVPFALTKDGFESQLGIDHVAHHLLFKKLAPLLLKSSTPDFHSRVVVVSTALHLFADVDYNDMNYTKGREYSAAGAYANAKLANIWFANHIERLYGVQGLHALSLSPGLCVTETVLNTPRQDLIACGMFTPEGHYNYTVLGKNAEQGAATNVWAATSPELEGKGGLYLDDVAIAGPHVVGSGNLAGYSAVSADQKEAAKMWEWTEQAISKFVQP
jgi:NAD(P)-dependent dehydrogenase (short-subunit alcohol dehydrogenase family)